MVKPIESGESVKVLRLEWSGKRLVPKNNQMGQSQSAAIPPPKAAEKKEPCKPCCACPETRKVRDECVFDKGEENCTELIKAHQDCMRKMGFNI
jgi:cytochrome c oxidase assembly protein subunit 17